MVTVHLIRVNYGDGTQSPFAFSNGSRPRWQSLENANLRSQINAICPVQPLPQK
jgi:hypothetical protein